MKMSQETWKIIGAFQRGDDSEIKKFTLAQLEQADTELGRNDKDNSHRLALQKRIKELEKTKDRRWNPIIGVVIAVVAGLFLWLFTWLF